MRLKGKRAMPIRCFPRHASVRTGVEGYFRRSHSRPTLTRGTPSYSTMSAVA